jgi:hypothetical protein
LGELEGGAAGVSLPVCVGGGRVEGAAAFVVELRGAVEEVPG